MRWALATLAALIALAAGLVSADAIPDLQCEHGWVAQHAGHSVSCAPRSCTADADCGGGRCVEIARCMRTQPMDTGMGELPPGAPRPTYEAALETLCAADGSCAEGTHCAHARECTEPPAASSSCACSTVRSRRSAMGLVGALVVVALVARRRARLARHPSLPRRSAKRPISLS